MIRRGKPDDENQDLLLPEEEARLRELLADPELGVAFRKGALAKNVRQASVAEDAGVPGE
ncbi:MAG: hypothetical protein ACYCVB_13455 [Bacilli bacterium]